MFESLVKLIIPTRKKSYSSNSAIPYRSMSTMSFYKDLSYDNTYPSISRLVNAFVMVRPYAVNAKGEAIEKAAVIDKLYHPNQEMSAVDFRETLAVMALVHRKVYLLVHRDVNGVAVEGGPITEKNLAGFTFLEGVAEVNDSGSREYITNGKRYTRNDVIEISVGVDPHSLGRGYSPSVSANKWASLDDYIAAYNAGLFENGAVPAGEFIITAPSVDDFNSMVHDMKKNHRGSGRNNNLMYTYRPVDPNTGVPQNSQIEWVPFAQSNNELSLSDIFDQANKKIDSVFGVPASIRGVNDNNTYASVRVDQQIFIEHAVKPLALKIWSRFTFEMNRLTGGLGYAIDFDLDTPGIAEEEAAQAQRKAVELGIIERCSALGYSLESTVDAFGLPNEYKLLASTEASEATRPDSDNPEVDDGGEVADTPTENKSSARKPKSAPDPKDEADLVERLVGIYGEMMRDQIEAAIETGRAEFDDTLVETATGKVVAFAAGYMLYRGKRQFNKMKKEMFGGELPTETGGKVSFDLDIAVREKYREHVLNVGSSYSANTQKEIQKVLGDAQASGDISKEALTDKLRELNDLNAWQVERLARTEAFHIDQRAELEAMTQLMNHSGRKIYKVWKTEPSPCDICAALDGNVSLVDVPVLSYGASLDLGDGKVFLNTYEDIAATKAHPNCRCTYEYKEGEQ